MMHKGNLQFSDKLIQRRYHFFARQITQSYYTYAY